MELGVICRNNPGVMEYYGMITMTALASSGINGIL